MYDDQEENKKKTFNTSDNSAIQYILYILWIDEVPTYLIINIFE